MKPYPSTPQLADASEGLLSSGHLWLREYVAGLRLRFQMKPSGLLVFGDRQRVFDDVPPSYEHAVRHVREQFDRDAFHDAVDDPSAYVFFGVTPCNVGIDYDWDRIPPFLGCAVWNEANERLLPIDKAERVFERLGLAPANVFQKEVSVRDFHPERFEIPESAWYDGPAAGVVIENRGGGRALIQETRVKEQVDHEPLNGEPTAVSHSLVTKPRVNRAIKATETHGKTATTTEIHARVFEMIVREEYTRLEHGNIDWKTLRSAVGSVVAERFDELADN
mgnify:CR=1 FL=1